MRKTTSSNDSRDTKHRNQTDIKRADLKLNNVHRAVLATLPFLALASLNTYAACSGSIASPGLVTTTSSTSGGNTTVTTATTSVLCNGTGVAGNISNSATGSGSAYFDEVISNITNTITGTNRTATGTNTLIQFDGQGRILNNTGDIVNNRVLNSNSTSGLGRTAVFMGAATLNASGNTLLGSAPSFSANTNTTTVTLNAVPTSAYIGQTLVFGRYNASEGDFAAGETRIITTVDPVAKTVTFAGELPTDYVGAGSDPIGYKVVSNYGAGTTVDGEFYNNVINNSGRISSQILASEIDGNKTGSTGAYASTSNVAAVKAITMSVEGDYLINNGSTGVISVKHGGIGAAYAIEQGGAVERLVINNAGTISAERTATLALSANSPTANPTAKATISGNTYAAQTLALVNAINTQEEAEEFTLNNTGTVRAIGDYTAAIYMRAGEKEIVNEGLIEHVGSKGFAIGAVSDPGSIRTLVLENTETGTINGDILVTNGNALRWYLLSTAGTLDSRLNINSQYGQSDSEIVNAGHITGNLYYSNGTHVLTNEATGVISGNIDLDQRNTVDLVGGVATVGALVGTKSFTFENAGSYSGNITVRTATGSVLTLIPTITGSGSGSTVDAPSANIAGMGGTLKVFNGTAATDGSNSTANLVTIAPKSLVTVHTGEYFKLADNLYGATLPEVSSVSTPLVNWTLTKNTGGNLVIGVDSVNSAATVAGVSASSATIIDALLAGNSAAGAAVQSLTEAADIDKAGKQLSPEANGGAYAGAQVATSQFSSLISLRQDVNQGGASGVSTGDAANANGLWFQGFGFTGEQDKRKNADGYDADTAGFGLGYDRVINDNLRLGFAGAYATTTVEANNTTNGNTTDIDSYQASVYGTYSFKDWYLDGQIGYAKHKFDSKRLVSVPVTDVAKGSFDADQYLIKVGANFPFKTSANLTLIPTIAAAYSYFDQDGYTERSNNGTGLQVKGRNTDSFRTGLGGKALLNLGDTSMPVTLEARALWWHEFSDVRQDTTARFAAGGSTFHVNGVKPDRDSGNVGLTLSASAKDASQVLSVSYDAEIRDQYIGHTGSITARFNF